MDTPLFWIRKLQRWTSYWLLLMLMCASQTIVPSPAPIGKNEVTSSPLLSKTPSFFSFSEATTSSQESTFGEKKYLPSILGESKSYSAIPSLSNSKKSKLGLSQQYGTPKLGENVPKSLSNKIAVQQNQLLNNGIPLLNTLSFGRTVGTNLPKEKDIELLVSSDTTVSLDSVGNSPKID